jgi:hypothetical protein
MKILKYKRPKPTLEEAKSRLDNMFEDFLIRGADAESVALLIMTYGVTEVLSYSENPEKGIQKIDDILFENFGLEKEIIFTPLKTKNNAF